MPRSDACSAELEAVRQQLQQLLQQQEGPTSPSATAQQLQALLSQKDRDTQRLQQQLHEQQQECAALAAQLEDHRQLIRQLQESAAAAAVAATVPAASQHVEQQQQQDAGPKLQQLLKAHSARAASSDGSRLPSSYGRSLSVSQALPAQQHQQPALLNAAHLERSLHGPGGGSSSKSLGGHGDRPLSLAASRAQSIPVELGGVVEAAVSTSSESRRSSQQQHPSERALSRAASANRQNVTLLQAAAMLAADSSDEEPEAAAEGRREGWVSSRAGSGISSSAGGVKPLPAGGYDAEKLRRSLSSGGAAAAAVAQESATRSQSAAFTGISAAGSLQASRAASMARRTVSFKGDADGGQGKLQHSVSRRQQAVMLQKAAEMLAGDDSD
jgi:hypothetical protein